MTNYAQGFMDKYNAIAGAAVAILYSCIRYLLVCIRSLFAAECD